MKIIVDMNLSPRWCDYLKTAGLNAIHWVEIGKPDAKDSEIFLYAKNNDYMLLTHDLDFAVILAHTAMDSPSVIQLRTRDTLPEKHATKVIETIKKYHKELTGGAIVTIDLIQSRVRIVPIKQ